MRAKLGSDRESASSTGWWKGRKIDESSPLKETYFGLVRRGLCRLLISPRFFLGECGVHLCLDHLLLGVRRHERTHTSVLRFGALIVRHILGAARARARGLRVEDF